MFRKAFAEFIGTFALVFAGTGAIVVNDLYSGVIGHVGVSITFGAIVMAMIHSIGNISGAHINPAVTISFWFAKRFNTKELIPYIVAQFTGALFASGILWLLFPEHETLGATIPSDDWVKAATFEFILTFLLMYVILNVSHGSKEEGIMAGAAIGLTVCLEALIGGPISGASMNPARSLGPAVFSGNFTHLWIYFVATTFGAVAAVFTCRISKPDDGCCDGSC